MTASTPIIAPLPFALGGFDVVLADPPWRFASNSAAKPGRNAMRHYPTMTVWDIASMPVREIVAKDALLLLWATVPLLDRAFEVISAWGFRYVSQVIWDKGRIGTGYWARNRHEPLLIATRGRFQCPRPLFGTSVIEAPRAAHSRKPDAIHEAVETRLPWAPQRLELFARRPREGWTVWGNEINSTDPVDMSPMTT